MVPIFRAEKLKLFLERFDPNHSPQGVLELGKNHVQCCTATHIMGLGVTSLHILMTYIMRSHGWIEGVTDDTQIQKQSTSIQQY